MAKKKEIIISFPCTQGNKISGCFGAVNVVVKYEIFEETKELDVQLNKSKEVFCDRCGMIYDLVDNYKDTLFLLRPIGEKKSKEDLIRIAIIKAKRGHKAL